MTLCDCSWFTLVIAAIIIYKILDRIIRIPLKGGLNERYILVTGCDTGFGHEISKRLDKKGVHVFAGCLTEKGEDDLKKQCSGRLQTIHMNVAEPASVRKAYETVKNALPPGKGLCGVMNNAGISGTVGPAEWLEIGDYHECFAVNLYGVIDTTVTFLPLVKKAKGRVVSTASIFGRTPLVGAAPYTLSKYGVEAFSDGLRRELRVFGCSVHLIEPGFHKTNIANPAALAGRFESTWQRLSPEMREEYGQEYFEKTKHFIVNEFITKIASDRISDVVDAYEHALLGAFPRARYVIGNDAKFFWLPVHWLPEWLGDWIHEKAKKDSPVPAIMKK